VARCTEGTRLNRPLRGSQPTALCTPRLNGSTRLRRNRMVQDLLVFAVPVNLLPFAVAARGHDHGDGVGEPGGHARRSPTAPAQRLDEAKTLVLTDNGQGLLPEEPGNPHIIGRNRRARPLERDAYGRRREAQRHSILANPAPQARLTLAQFFKTGSTKAPAIRVRRTPGVGDRGSLG